MSDVDRQYRRGLVLGLTVAEVMILLIFVLLMALAAALQARDKQIAVLDQGGASRLVEALQREYPKAQTKDDYFKELVLAIEARRQIERDNPGGDSVALLEDAQIGRNIREAAEKEGAADPMEFARNLASKDTLDDAAVGRDVREAAEKEGIADPREFARNLASDAKSSRKGKWPPFVSLSEAGGYYFDTGKATLRAEFESNLISKVIPMLASYLEEYEVDVIEVIGHTDEVPMVGQSNLDAQLVSAAAGRFPIAGLRSTDNAGLAMARAVSVVHVMRADPRLTRAAILPMSGAQMIVPVDRMADGSAQGSDQQRRRIEIRLRRSTTEAVSTAVPR